MRIRDVFRRPIDRTIEEVIKVELDDEKVVAGEIDEYIATKNIVDSLTRVLDAYRERLAVPGEETNVWISGFFGSGKSSFAKVLGYLLQNHTLEGQTATERFFARTEAPAARALLHVIHKPGQPPPVVVFVDLLSSRNVHREGESVVLPLYRALLTTLGYASSIIHAELEVDLEVTGQLVAFEQEFSVQFPGQTWKQRRDVTLAKQQASRVLHALDPATYSSPDTFARTIDDPVINASWFADRALELVGRRGNGAQRVVFVVDEVGQYVSRSVDRVSDLQGLAEAFQRKRGPLWLMATSQEKLEDVVDSLEGKKVEMARAKDRFPIRIDLLPSDIDEVTSRRVLEKNDGGQQAIRAALSRNRNQLATHIRLDSPARADDPSEDELVRLYPLVPYQVQLLIDAVSTRRAHGGGTGMLGGSNRTIIKLAQQLVVASGPGLGQEDVGRLVTIDRAYDLLESIIPTAWRGEVDQVIARHGALSIEAKICKVVALCVDVRALPLTPKNLAVLLHEGFATESLESAANEAVTRLVSEEVLRQADDGVRLQSPEEKDWEKKRREIDPRPADLIRLWRESLAHTLRGFAVTSGRSFRVEVHAADEKLTDGEIALRIEEAVGGRRAELKERSRDEARANDVTVAFSVSDPTHDGLVEWFQSKEMISRRDVPGTKSPAEHELIAEERQRLQRLERTARDRLAADIGRGVAVFRGTLEELSNGDLRATLQRAIEDRIPQIFPQSHLFAGGPLRPEHVRMVLRAESLAELPDPLGQGGMGLLEDTPEGRKIKLDDGPLRVVVDWVTERHGYGQDPSGQTLAQRFAGPPYGGHIDTVQLVLAAGIRAGQLEVVFGGHRISSSADDRLLALFKGVQAFRGATFRPANEPIALERRVNLARNLHELTGDRPKQHTTAALAEIVRLRFGPLAEVVGRVEAALRGFGLAAPAAVAQARELAGAIRTGEDEGVVLTALDRWSDLLAVDAALQKLDKALNESADALRLAIAIARQDADEFGSEDAKDLQRLRELLRAGDLADQQPQIRALADRLETVRGQRRQEAIVILNEHLRKARERVTERYREVDPGVVAEASRQLEDLAAASADRLSVRSLRERGELVAVRAVAVERDLDAIVTKGEISEVSVAAVVPDTITGPDDLDAALTKLREEVEIHLAAERQVRLR